MNFFDYKVHKVEITNVDIRVVLTDGRESIQSIENFPLLHKATDAERKNYEIIGGYALYWKNLGEDLSIAGFFE